MRQAAPNKQDKRAYSALNRTGQHIHKTFCFLSLAGRALPTRLSLRSHFSCARQMRHHFYIRRRLAARAYLEGAGPSAPRKPVKGLGKVGETSELCTLQTPANRHGPPTPFAVHRSEGKPQTPNSKTPNPKLRTLDSISLTSAHHVL